MFHLKRSLAKKLESASRVALLGIGSQDCADDSAGMLVVRSLKKHLGTKKQRICVKLFFGSSAPENITGEIRKFKPSDVIIIDAADTGKQAGKISFIPVEGETGISFSTHRLPVKILIDYLKWSLGCRVILLGIQPKCVIFGEPVCKQVEKSVETVCSAIKEILFIPTHL